MGSITTECLMILPAFLTERFRLLDQNPEMNTILNKYRMLKARQNLINRNINTQYLKTIILLHSANKIQSQGAF